MKHALCNNCECLLNVGDTVFKFSSLIYCSSNCMHTNINMISSEEELDEFECEYEGDAE